MSQPPSPPAERQAFGRFLLFWLGQFLSQQGSGLTSFAVGVWALQEQGSVTQYSALFLTASLPGVLLSPFAGVFADRWSRRQAMALADSGAALLTLLMAVLYANGLLEVWHLYLTTAVTSSLSALQWPAYAAAVADLAPPRQLGRAAGLTEVSRAVSTLLSPMLGALLLTSVGLAGVLFLDLGTFLLGLGSLALVRIPRPATEPGRSAGDTYRRDLKAGLDALLADRPLVRLLVLDALVGFRNGLVNMMAAPLLLSFAPVSVLGTVLTLCGTGMLFGSLGLAAWGGPQRRLRGMLTCEAFAGLALIVAGVTTRLPFFALAGFLYYLCLPVGAGLEQAVWQARVSPAVRGRVFALRRLVSWLPLPLSFLVAGPLSEHLLEPWLAGGSALAAAVGALIGEGPRRSLGLLFALLGLLTLAGIVAARCSRSLSQLDAPNPSADRSLGVEPETSSLPSGGIP